MIPVTGYRTKWFAVALLQKNGDPEYYGRQWAFEYANRKLTIMLWFIGIKIGALAWA